MNNYKSLKALPLIALLICLLYFAGCSGRSNDSTSGAERPSSSQENPKESKISNVLDSITGNNKERLSRYEQLFEDGPILAEDENHLTGYIGSDGSWVIEPRYRYAWKDDKESQGYERECDKFNDGLARVKDTESQLWGFIDGTGNWAIEAKYSELHNFSEDLAAAEDPETELWGYIDKNGTWVIQPKFKVADDFSEGMAAVQDGDYKEFNSGKSGDWHTPRVYLSGYIDKSGEYIIQPQYGAATQFREGRAFVSDVETFKLWIIDEKGTRICSYDIEFAPIDLFFGGKAFLTNLSVEGSVYMIGLDGEVLCSQYNVPNADSDPDNIRADLDHGYIKLGNNVLDREGTVVCNLSNLKELLESVPSEDGNPLKCTFLEIISDKGYAAFEMCDWRIFTNGTGEPELCLLGTNIIDLKTGDTVGPLYNNIYLFDGEIHAIKGDAEYIIDDEGNILKNLSLSAAETWVDGKPKIGFKNPNGEVLIDYVYDYGGIGHHSEFRRDHGGYLNVFTSDMSYALVKQNGLFGMINEKGNWLIEPKCLNIALG